MVAVKVKLCIAHRRPILVGTERGRWTEVATESRRHPESRLNSAAQARVARSIVRRCFPPFRTDDLTRLTASFFL